ncbi:MAG: hypothetical protein F6K13_06120 [Okeania sp. SIO2B9]|nr:hypothetical protein [Okeania hirsuta]NES88810.1 hypothetical protein [Okeania sp. SIO2B9]
MRKFKSCYAPYSFLTMVEKLLAFSLLYKTLSIVQNFTSNDNSDNTDV